jgi:peptide deformylase
MAIKLKKGFVQPNDPILIKKAEAIPLKEIALPKTQKLVERMLDLAYGEQKDRKKPVLVGLAAPQVGISKRIILVDIGADGHGKVSDLKIYLNPKIVWKSKKKATWYEGCFSTSGVCGIVERPYSVKVEAYGRDGKKFSEKHKGYVARIFQHEIDHLNGIEFVKHINNDNNLHWVKDDEFPKYRDKEAWRSWPRKCSREKWEKIKGIKK